MRAAAGAPSACAVFVHHPLPLLCHSSGQGGKLIKQATTAIKTHVQCSSHPSLSCPVSHHQRREGRSLARSKAAHRASAAITAQPLTPAAPHRRPDQHIKACASNFATSSCARRGAAGHVPQHTKHAHQTCNLLQLTKTHTRHTQKAHAWGRSVILMHDAIYCAPSHTFPHNTANAHTPTCGRSVILMRDAIWLPTRPPAARLPMTCGGRGRGVRGGLSWAMVGL